ncbi:hypothetical protein MKZ38_006091 [Zalerion maritima]|uniref:Uncharacterized protein n=1 Tax=Zalerion maritima TaxID=339359 RepID=A0AAD5WWD9_9PEZI|nr:hypothetical protein MKZ38_006091 [Zalerion maritima]
MATSLWDRNWDWSELLNAPHNLDYVDRDGASYDSSREPAQPTQSAQPAPRQRRNPAISINMEFFDDADHDERDLSGRSRRLPNGPGGRVIPDSDRESSLAVITDTPQESSGAESEESADFESSQEVDMVEDDAEPWDLPSEDAVALFGEGGSPPSSLGDEDRSQNRNRNNRPNQPNIDDDDDDVGLFVSDDDMEVDLEDDYDVEEEEEDLFVVPAASRNRASHRVEPRHQSRRHRAHRAAGETGRGRAERRDDAASEDDLEEVEFFRERNMRERDYSPASGFRDILRSRIRRRSASPDRNVHGSVNHASGSYSHTDGHPGEQREVRRGTRIGIDELIDVEFEPPAPHAATSRRLIQSSSGRSLNRNNSNSFNNNNHRHNLHRNNSNNRSMSTLNNQPAEVIDLTEDSPPVAPFPITLPQDPRESRNPQAQRNPRRVGPRFPRNPPVLARSDGSALGAQVNNEEVIDLTADPSSPEYNISGAAEEDGADDGDIEFLGGRERAPLGHRPAAIDLAGFFEQHRNSNNRFGRLLNDAMDHFGNRLGNHFGIGHLPEFLGFGLSHNRHQHHPQVANMNADQNPLPYPPNLNYGYAAFGNNNANPDKPAYLEPSPPPEGFTRNTGAAGFDKDEIAVCPSCDEELAYDPDSGDEEEPEKPSPAKKKAGTSKKSKKKNDKHHLFAVKECGHTSKGWDQTMWRLSTGEVADGTTWKELEQPANGKAKKVYCAIEDCNTDVRAASAWVGIFM